MGAAAEGVLSPVAVETEELKAILGEPVTLEPAVNARPDPSSVPCPVPVNMVDGKEGWFGFRAAAAFISIGSKDFCPEPVPGFQTLFPPPLPVGVVSEAPNFLFASSAVRGITSPVKRKTVDREYASAACASATSSSCVKLPVFPNSSPPSFATPFGCGVCIAPPTRTDQPSSLNQAKMPRQKNSLTFVAASVRFHKLYGSRYESLNQLGAC